MSNVNNPNYREALNDQQWEVVKSSPGPALVIAGAGSGKTRTLTYRVAWLIDKGIHPSNILLVTFTNKAAGEMLKRVNQLTGISQKSIWGGTFHHIGHIILRQQAEKLGLNRDFIIVDQKDSNKLLDECRKELMPAVFLKESPKASVISDIIGYSINTMLTIEEVLVDRFIEYERWREWIDKIAVRYKKRKYNMNLIDFDDMLFLWNLLYEQNNEILLNDANKFNYLLIDEYQDTSKLQANIIKLLAQNNGENIMVVGDDCQSIYSFRGANYKNILEFPEIFPNSKLYKLEQNYRSTDNILQIANHSISFNSDQYSKELFSNIKSQKKPVIVVLPNVDYQAKYVVQKIFQLIDTGTPPGQIAVLYRAHYHSMELQLELTKYNIPFVVRSGIRYFEQAHIKDILALLRVTCNPFDQLAWLRIFKNCNGIGEKTAQKILRIISNSHSPLYLTVDDLKGVSAKAKKSFMEVLELLKCNLNNPYDDIMMLLGEYYDPKLTLMYTDANEKADDIRQLAQYAKQYTSNLKFINDVTLLSEMSSHEGIQNLNEDFVVLSTIHQAKGLEWEAVFVLWLCEGKFPSKKANFSIKGIEEERRLFYVAITRAKESLYLCRPVSTRGEYWDVVETPSRFIKNLPEEFYELEDYSNAF